MQKIQNLYSTILLSILCLIILAITIPNVSATEQIYFPPALGPTLAYSGAVNGFTNPQGRKNGIALNHVPDAGLSLYIPMEYIFNLGIYADFMYNTHTFLMKYNYDGVEEIYRTKDRMRFSYVTIAPSFSHAGFMLGFSIGIPVSADWEGVNISTDKLNNLYEVKVGYSYPITYDETSRLNVFINASYALNGIYQDFVKDDPLSKVVPAQAPQIITNYYNPRPAGVQIGFQFLFNLIELSEGYYEADGN